MNTTRILTVALAVVALVALGTAAPALAQDCDRYDHGGLRPPSDPSPDVACGGPGFTAPPQPQLGTGSLSTIFASNNGFAGNTFDVTVNSPLTITSFEINIDSPGSTSTADIYWRLGTSVGNENNAGAWTLLGSDTNVVSAGTDTPTPVNVGGLTLTPGNTYGFYFDLSTYPSAVVNYTNGGPTLFSNVDMGITTNTGQSSPAFSGSFFPRQWNGTIFYDLGGDSDLDLTKTADPEPVAPGGTLTYTLTVTNNGPDDAPNTVVTDTLPAEFSYTGDDCGGSVMGGPPGGTWTWMVGSLANGASAVCNVSGTIDPATPNGAAIVNSATASSDNTDPTPGNETAVATTTVNLNILEIPTLSQVGLAVLLVLLALIAVWRIRRAQHA